MAIYFFRMKVGTRKAGQSAVASASYRSGDYLYDQRIGKAFSYDHKRGIEYSEILLPDGASTKFVDRAYLWNAVEATEKRKDAQLYREVVAALPRELERKEQIQLAKEYVQRQFVEKGMIADLCLHDTGKGNPHLHIMLTLREVDGEGFGKKNRSWNDKSLLKQWRREWAISCNQFLEKEDQITEKKNDYKGELEELSDGINADTQSLKMIGQELSIRNRIIQALKRAREFIVEKLDLAQWHTVKETPEREYTFQIGRGTRTMPELARGRER